jgi:hypothetical protein
MKLAETTREVITNTDNKHDFRIQANAKMFQILSSKIYSYPLAAIVREISCNAYDAHVEAGKSDVPFRVVLPNDLHPYFEIEDFGIGLSEDGVYEVYTEYGNSTKTDSNDVIGALGLGSKTPFAYTTTFTIQTRKDGVECLFNAYIGDNGAPSVSLLRKRDTDESNGVKIKIPVKSGQEDLFRKECEFILSFFPVRPNVVGNSSFNFSLSEEDATSIHNGDMTVVDVSNVVSELYRSRRLYAVMGTVCYPIAMLDIADMDDKLYRYLEQVVLEGRHSNAAFVNFNIGDLEVSASREGLSIEDGKSTKKTLVQRFSDAVTSLIDKDKELIEHCTHPNQALKVLKDKYGDVLSLVAGQFKYQGRTLDKLVQRQMKSPYDEVYYSAESRHWWSSSNKVNKTYSCRAVNIISTGYVILTARDKKTRGWIKHAREVAKDNHGLHIVCTEKAWTQHQIDRYIQYIGFEPKEIVYLEDLKDTPVAVAKKKAKRPPKQKQEVTACSFVVSKTGVQYQSQKRLDIDELRKDYSIFYATRSDSLPRSMVQTDFDGYSTLSDDILRALTMFTGDMIIVLKNDKNTKSIEYNDIKPLTGELERIRDNHSQEVRDFMEVTQWFTTSNSYLHFKSEFIECARLAKSPVLPRRMHDLYERGTELIDQVQQYSTVTSYRFLSSLTTIDTVDAENEESELVSQLKRAYPMLHYVNGYRLNPETVGCLDTERVLQYMNLVDSQNNHEE